MKAGPSDWRSFAGSYPKIDRLIARIAQFESCLRRPGMLILALDLGKYKTVACKYDSTTGEHRFARVSTTPSSLHDLIVDYQPARVVFVLTGHCVLRCLS